MKSGAFILALFLPLQLLPGREPDAEARAKLDANGLVVLDVPLNQGFSAYIGAARPVFITSDSLLMAYHRLLEEVANQAEVAEEARSRRFWRSLWENLPRRSAEEVGSRREEGLRRSRLVVATGLRLLAGKLPSGLSEVEIRLVSEEAERVEKGEGTAPPPWILPEPGPQDVVSYKAFIPTGSAAGDPAGECYYRFRKWLQEMQVAPSDLATVSMMEHLAMGMERMDGKDREAILPAFSLTARDAGLLDRLVNIVPASNVAAKIREETGHVRRIRLLQSGVPAGSRICRKLLAEAPSKIGRTPLAVAALLGNPLASAQIDPAVAKLAAEAWDFSTPEDSGEKLVFLSYFDALRALGSPDDRSPSLFVSEPWQRKQLNTILGSWAEYRYATQAGSREDTLYFGMVSQDPGFVEPVPAFYRHLGESAESLSTARSFLLSGDEKRAAMLSKLLRTADALRKIGIQDEPSASLEQAVRPELPLLYNLFPDLQPPVGGFPAPIPDKKRCLAIADRIGALETAWKKGDENTKSLLSRAIIDEKDPIGPRLSRLTGICYRLEAMAERQLAGRPWSEGDKEFLVTFGETLAWLMFYEGNSYLTPRDDAPRIARYATLIDSKGKSLSYHAATARPRLLLIRHPDNKGQGVLCQGAVYSYRDVACETTPTPDGWTAVSGQAPPPPWMVPNLGPATPIPDKQGEPGAGK